MWPAAQHPSPRNGRFLPVPEHGSHPQWLWHSLLLPHLKSSCYAGKSAKEGTSQRMRLLRWIYKWELPSATANPDHWARMGHSLLGPVDFQFPLCRICSQQEWPWAGSEGEKCLLLRPVSPRQLGNPSCQHPYAPNLSWSLGTETMWFLGCSHQQLRGLVKQSTKIIFQNFAWIIFLFLRTKLTCRVLYYIIPFQQGQKGLFRGVYIRVCVWNKNR